jgi:hypothetical protein
MNNYMIELHNVPHELQLYIEEIKMYGNIQYNSSRYVWLETMWDEDILKNALGVKKVYPKRFSCDPFGMTEGRNWTELIGTKYDTTL